MALLPSFNRTNYGIETRANNVYIRRIKPFNRTNYGIETFFNCLTGFLFKALLIAPIMELKHRYVVGKSLRPRIF